MAGSTGYRGRFAPSPTGPLHLGSLVAALASFLDARQHGGTWLLRMEDIDPPREPRGAAQQIRDALRRHGLHWDGESLQQSSRHGAYREALSALRQRGLVFPCACTRATLGPGGSCRRRCRPRDGQPQALRLALPAQLPGFEDLLCGPQAAVGIPRDIVLWRKDGLPAYALAVSVDDHWQRISHVLRGADLIAHTAVQRHLIRLLGGAAPLYGHLPLAYGADGRKLSKQNGAPALEDARALDNLRRALRLLRQDAADADAATPEALLAQAIPGWRPQAAALAANGAAPCDARRASAAPPAP